MAYGKKVCKILKEIRQQIADQNEIAYITSECHFKGECKGTCPKCEAELKYLEDELNKRKLLGKAASIAGISLGLAGTFSTCNAPQPQLNTPISEQEIATENVCTDTIRKDTIFAVPANIPFIDLLGIVEPFDTLDGEIDPNWSNNLVVGEMIGTFPNILPEFFGGLDSLTKFIQTNLIYPKEAGKENIAGKVIVEFVIEKDGSVTNCTIIKSVNPVLDAEALRVVKLMPDWKPGEQMGNPDAGEKRGCHQAGRYHRGGAGDLFDCP